MARITATSEKGFTCKHLVLAAESCHIIPVQTVCTPLSRLMMSQFTRIKCYTSKTARIMWIIYVRPINAAFSLFVSRIIQVENVLGSNHG